MQKMTVRDVDVNGKRVFVRADLNVPLDKATSAVTDDSRIRASLPTIQYLIEHNAKVIVASHLGRPDGKVVENLRLDPVAKRMSELIGKPVKKLNDCIGPEVKSEIDSMKPGDVVLLENLRFHAEEEANDPAFAKTLAGLADVFVNDAFGTAHRAHASTAGIAYYIPAVAGFLLEKEIDYMGKALTNPERPFAAIIGGAKVSTKISVLDNLLGKVDLLLIGGGMANTFLKAQGLEIGKSLVEDDKVDVARNLLTKAKDQGVKVLLPVDVVVGDKFAADAQAKVVPVDQAPPDWMIMDIGPRTIELFRTALQDCKTVIWNGPMGVFEFDKFAQGTREIAAILARLNATTIVGGGESVAAVEQMGYADKMTHVSTGGGASLEYLEGKTLPGVAALNDKRS